MSALTITPETRRMDLDQKIKDCMSYAKYFNSHYGMSDTQRQELVRIALQLKPEDQIVELGVCNGGTGAVLAASCMYTGAVYTGVDLFLIDCYDPDEVEEYGQDYKKDAAQITKRLGAEQFRFLSDRYDERQLQANIAFANTYEYAHEFQSQVSLLIIDAGHDENNVKRDVANWLPWLVPGGVVAFHDYDDPYDKNSPHWAVRMYADMETEGWERKLIENMLVAVKPE